MSSHHYIYQNIIAPPSTTSKISSHANAGRELLDLIRSRDKLLRKATSTCTANYSEDFDHALSRRDESPIDINELEQEIITLLLSLSVSIRRRGLLNEIQRAYNFYTQSLTSTNCASSSRAVDTETGEGRGSKKRKRKGGDNSATGERLTPAMYGIFIESHANLDFSASTGRSHQKDFLDEAKIITALCKILGVTSWRKEGEERHGNIGSNPGSSGMIFAALSTLSAICDYANDRRVQSSSYTSANIGVCRLVEVDMISSIGSHLLEALRDTILYFQYSKEHLQGRNDGLIATFKATASLISLLETKLSRVENILPNLCDAVTLTLYDQDSYEENNISIIKAASLLLASFPLLGNPQSNLQSLIWSRSVENGLLLLRLAIDDVFPISTDGEGSKSVRNIRSDKIMMEEKSHSVLLKDHTAWISMVKDASTKGLNLDATDHWRATSFLLRIRFLTEYLTSLIEMEGYPIHRDSFTNLGVVIPLDLMLDVSEMLLSFPLVAEAKHRSTKQRLQSSPVDGGLISPNTAMNISVEIRLCGHALLKTALKSSRNGSGAFGRSRRMVTMSLTNLQSTSSLALVSVIEGKKGVGSSSISKIGSQLRRSIPLRVGSVQVFHSTVISLGTGIISSTATSKSVSRSLVLVGGCLLEQVEYALNFCGSEEWGTLGERVKLIESCSYALAASIATLGGLIPIDIRGTIDSITLFCLSALCTYEETSVFAYSDVKKSMLQLAVNSVCVPWGDGGRSTITRAARNVASMLRHDPDMSVASVALSVLCACNAIVTPRAPPLLIPSRNSDDTSTNVSASCLLQGIKKATEEMMNQSEQREKKTRKSTRMTSDRAHTNSTDNSSSTILVTDSTTSQVSAIGCDLNLKSDSTSSSKVCINEVENTFATVTKDDDKGSDIGSTLNDMNVIAASMVLMPSNKENKPEEMKTSFDQEVNADINIVEGTDENIDSDDISLGDFPDIVAGDPDEEDRKRY